jgi:hypothetical protein
VGGILDQKDVEINFFLLYFYSEGLERALLM